MTITALIDGDWILYAAGFAGQKTAIVCPSYYGALELKTMTSLRERLEADGFELNESEDPTYSRSRLDPDTHFLQSAKKMIEGNCNKIAEKFGEEVEPYVIIDGDGNFRSQAATIRPYKGQRSVHAKPLMYNNIRAYLLDHWDAKVVYNQESDDEMAILQTAMTLDGKKSVIVSIDKDMLQVPGWHLNPNKGFKKISEGEGLWRLYVQCVQGDTVDNIGGAAGFGPAKAKQYILPGMSELEMWHATLDAYETSMRLKGEGIYGGLTEVEAATENMRLVYLRRQQDETWQPPEEG